MGLSVDKLFKLLEKNPHLRNLSSQLVIEKRIKNNWKSIFGDLSNEFYFHSFRDRKLIVETINPCWKTEVNHLRGMILEKISDVLGKDKVSMFHVKHVLSRQQDGIESSTKNKPTSKDSLGLHEKIELSNKRKREKGKKLCAVCDKMYTSENVCFTCVAKRRFYDAEVSREIHKRKLAKEALVEPKATYRRSMYKTNIDKV